MSTTTALKVPPSAIGSSIPTPTKEKATRQNSISESKESISSSLGGENKPKISPEDITSPLELTNYVDSIIDGLEANFDEMSSQILSRMDQMSHRVDALEASIQDIINGGVSVNSNSLPQSPSPGTPGTQK